MTQARLADQSFTPYPSVTNRHNPKLGTLSLCVRLYRCTIIVVANRFASYLALSIQEDEAPVLKRPDLDSEPEGYVPKRKRTKNPQGKILPSAAPILEYTDPLTDFTQFQSWWGGMFRTTNWRRLSAADALLGSKISDFGASTRSAYDKLMNRFLVTVEREGGNGELPRLPKAAALSFRWSWHVWHHTIVGIAKNIRFQNNKIKKNIGLEITSVWWMTIDLGMMRIPRYKSTRTVQKNLSWSKIQTSDYVFSWKVLLYSPHPFTEKIIYSLYCPSILQWSWKCQLPWWQLCFDQGNPEYEMLEWINCEEHFRKRRSPPLCRHTSALGAIFFFYVARAFR